MKFDLIGYRSKLFLIIEFLFLFFLIKPISSSDTTKIWGVTLDSVDSLDDIIDALEHHSQKITCRVVFDEHVSSNYYIEPCSKIHEISNIMGELLDSYYFKEYSTSSYTDRVNEYVNNLKDYVDIWEIGNEINGEWLGNSDSVIKKINIAYDIIKGKKLKTALTLYYNYNCWDNPDNEMFTWVNNNLSSNIRNGLDYLFVSYYEDDCNNLQPDWQNVFDKLHILFPNSKLGIGECGTKFKKKKAEFIQRYYSMKIETPNYIGGYFWWYYKKDCVPSSKPLWKLLNDILKSNN